MNRPHRWYQPEPTTAIGWDLLTRPGPDLAAAARAARTLGRSQRALRDHVVTAVLAVTLFAFACGAVPVLLVTLACRQYAVVRARRLDRPAWTIATPTRGARVYRASEVSCPDGLDPYDQRFRWWSVRNEAGHPVFGLAGARAKGTERCIVPGTAGAGRGPVDVPGFWVANAVIYTASREPGYAVLHLRRADGRPVVAIRFSDPAQRLEIEVLVYSPEVLDDPDLAILSCLALFVHGARVRRPRTPLPTPPLDIDDRSVRLGSPPNPSLPASEVGWPLGFFDGEPAGRADLWGTGAQQPGLGPTALLPRNPDQYRQI